jgi:hypothetical protein
MPYDFIGSGEDGEPAVVNLPSIEGAALGRQLARFADVEADNRQRQGQSVPKRCGECAFRKGTDPNRCLSTVANALKCAVEGEPFYCHVNVPNGTEPTHLCAGWLMLAGGSARPDEPRRAPILLPPMSETP